MRDQPSRIPPVTALAGAMFLSVAAQAQVQVTYPTSETALSQILNSHRYGGHAQVWADIRTEPVSLSGATHPGHISIHARDYRGGQCRWDLVIEARKAPKDWFAPTIYQRFPGCGSPELNHDDSILAMGVSVWLNNAVVDLSARAPIGDPTQRLAGQVQYLPDRIVFVVTRLDVRMKEPQRQTPGLPHRLQPQVFPRQ